MQSCFYEGEVRHTRRLPVKHRFAYRLGMVYLDLDELDSHDELRDTFRGGGVASLCFRESDHLRGLPEENPSLAARVRSFVKQRVDSAPEGPIRLLTQPRQLGHYFSPLNLYYCFHACGKQLHSVVAEVSNTPWNERHHYLLRPDWQATQRIKRFEHAKGFHVSPFMDMNFQYDWRLSIPNDSLLVAINNLRDEQTLFRASMSLKRLEFSRSNARLYRRRYSLMSWRILAAIYWQAFWLWNKKCTYYPHP